MAIYTHRSSMPTTPEELFLFHENPHNLRLLPTPGMQILKIRAEEKASPGGEFAVTIRRGPLTLSWVGRWERVEPSRLLVDVGISCPFALWRHEHRFEAAGDSAMLTDRIEFQLPWHRGGRLGDWVAQRAIFPRMFAARHEATRRFFAGR